MKHIYVIIPILSALSIASYKNAHAESTSLTVNPSTTIITAQAQSEISIPLQITNSSDSEKLLTISFLGFRPSSNNKQVHEYYLEDSTPHDLSSLLKTIKVYDGENQIKSITLFPQETKELRIIFNAPSKQGADFYFSPMFTFFAPSDGQNKSTNIQTAQSVGSNILLSIAPTKNAKITISEFSTSPVILSGPIHLSFKLQNESTNFASVNGTLALYNFSGKQIYTQKIPETIILAKSNRNITNENSPSFQVHGKLTGIYTLKTDLRVNDAYSIQQSTNVIYIPFIYLIVIIAVLFLALSLGYKIIKKIQFRNNL